MTAEYIPPKLDADDVATLQRFAAEYGREWKQYLMAAWLSYSYKGRHMAGRDTGTLRTLRNTHGQEWLERYKLPKKEG